MPRWRISSSCLACKYGHVAIAKTLIERGARVNVKHHDGNTSLHLSCYMYHIDVALMLEEGAHQTNSMGSNCLTVVMGVNPPDGCTLAEAQKLHSKAVLQDAYTRESRWRRRRAYAMFLSTIKNAVKDHRLHPTSVPINAVLERVLCGTDTQRLIGSYL